MPRSKYVQSLRSLIGHDLIIMPSVTGLVFDESDRVLLIKHTDVNRWVLPGGSIEPGETPANAVVREVWEETGLQVKPISICGVFGGPDFKVTYSNGDQVSYIMTVFACDIIGGTIRRESDEASDAKFFTPEEWTKLEILPWVRIVLNKVGRESESARFDAPGWSPPK